MYYLDLISDTAPDKEKKKPKITLSQLFGPKAKPKKNK